jgi:hypothetical protein
LIWIVVTAFAGTFRSFLWPWIGSTVILGIFMGFALSRDWRRKLEAISKTSRVWRTRVKKMVVLWTIASSMILILLAGLFAWSVVSELRPPENFQPNEPVIFVLQDEVDLLANIAAAKKEAAEALREAIGNYSSSELMLLSKQQLVLAEVNSILSER